MRDRVRVRVSKHALVALPWHIRTCYISPISPPYLAYISPNLGGLAVAHLQLLRHHRVLHLVSGRVRVRVRVKVTVGVRGRARVRVRVRVKE